MKSRTEKTGVETSSKNVEEKKKMQVYESSTTSSSSINI